MSVIAGNCPEEVNYRRFDNNRAGCLELLSWLKGQGNCSREDRLFCGEHTGLYSMQLSEFIIKKGLFMWLENPLQIKLSTGIKRDKSDRADSRDIALYAHRYRDRDKRWQLPDASLKSPELLLSFRERLLQNKHTLLVSSAEIRSVIKRDKTARYIYEQSKRDIERINRGIKDIEGKMTEIIESSEKLKDNPKMSIRI